MLQVRIQASSFLLGCLLMASWAVPAVMAEDYVTVGTLSQAASRCTDFGPGFVEMGNGICGRVGTTARVQLGTQSATSNAWSNAGTSSATLRSDGMLPGASVQHLRVRSGLDPYAQFK